MLSSYECCHPCLYLTGILYNENIVSNPLNIDKKKMKDTWWVSESKYMILNNLLIRGGPARLSRRVCLAGCDGGHLKRLGGLGVGLESLVFLDECDQ